MTSIDAWKCNTWKLWKKIQCIHTDTILSKQKYNSLIMTYESWKHSEDIWQVMFKFSLETRKMDWNSDKLNLNKIKSPSSTKPVYRHTHTSYKTGLILFIYKLYKMRTVECFKLFLTIKKIQPSHYLCEKYINIFSV